MKKKAKIKNKIIHKWSQVLMWQWARRVENCQTDHMSNRLWNLSNYCKSPECLSSSMLPSWKKSHILLNVTFKLSRPSKYKAMIFESNEQFKRFAKWLMRLHLIHFLILLRLSLFTWHVNQQNCTLMTQILN